MAALRCKKNKVESPTFDEYDDTRHIIPLLNGGSAIHKRDAIRWLQLFFIPCDQKLRNRILVICLTKWNIYHNLSVNLSNKS